jgi:butyrate kinase
VKIFIILARASSTEIAIYDGMDEILNEVVRHSSSELYSLRTPSEQGQYRFNALIDALAARGYEIKDIDVILTQVASYTLPPGIYMVDERLLDLLADDVIDENQLRSGVFATHLLSQYINDHFDSECLPLVVQPAIDDEILPEASLSGIKGIARMPRYNAFSQRTAVAFFAWYELRKDKGEIRAISAHLSKEISVGAHDLGRIVDSNSPQDGEGPLTPISSGALPIDALIDLCYSGKYDMDEIITMVSQKSGLSAYLEDSSLEYVSAEYRTGNKKVIFLVEAMACGVAREIGARAASMRGKVDGIVLTGPWARFDEFVELIASRVKWIAPVRIYATKGEMSLLAKIAEEAFQGIHKIFLYGRDRG